MARIAGIGMEEARLFVSGAGERFFGAKRFDRLAGKTVADMGRYYDLGL